MANVWGNLLQTGRRMSSTRSRRRCSLRQSTFVRINSSCDGRTRDCKSCHEEKKNQSAKFVLEFDVWSCLTSVYLCGWASDPQKVNPTFTKVSDSSNLEKWIKIRARTSLVVFEPWRWPQGSLKTQFGGLGLGLGWPMPWPWPWRKGLGLGLGSMPRPRPYCVVL